MFLYAICHIAGFVHHGKTAKDIAIVTIECEQETIRKLPNVTIFNYRTLSDHLDFKFTLSYDAENLEKWYEIQTWLQCSTNSDLYTRRPTQQCDFDTIPLILLLLKSANFGQTTTNVM